MRNLLLSPSPFSPLPFSPLPSRYPSTLPPQVCHDMETEVDFAIPTGAGGDLFGGYIAYRLGLPVNQFLVAVNQNRMLATFFVTGKMTRPKELLPTYANAIDIVVPSVHSSPSTTF